MALVELGQEQIGEIIASSNPNMIDINTETQTVIGDMYFEMSNHLGNVLATITDRKTYNPNDGYYEPVITMKADYYAFGMLMPNRFEGVDDTRHLFNGMEHDGEVSGEGNSYTTEFRQYDPRLGRWKSLDPLMSMFPHISPYVGFANNPIFFTDPYGLAPTNGDGEPEKKGNGKETEEGSGEFNGHQDVEEATIIGKKPTPEIKSSYFKQNSEKHYINNNQNEVFLAKLVNNMPDVNNEERNRFFEGVQVMSDEGFTFVFGKGIGLTKNKVEGYISVSNDKVVLGDKEGGEIYDPYLVAGFSGKIPEDTPGDGSFGGRITIYKDGKVYAIKRFHSDDVKEKDYRVGYMSIVNVEIALPKEGNITFEVTIYSGTSTGHGAASSMVPFRETTFIPRNKDILRQDK